LPNREADDREPSFFAEFEEIERAFARMMRALGDRLGDLHGEPLFFGLGLERGPTGEARVREFGNVPAIARGRATAANVRVPFASTIASPEEDEVNVTIELPGVRKEDVRLSADPSGLDVEAEGHGRRYATRVDLPEPVDPESAEARFKNGILEVKLKRAPKASGPSERVEVE
jgi:HSP20 family protein